MTPTLRLFPCCILRDIRPRVYHGDLKMRVGKKIRHVKSRYLVSFFFHFFFQVAIHPLYCALCQAQRKIVQIINFFKLGPVSFTQRVHVLFISAGLLLRSFIHPSESESIHVRLEFHEGHSVVTSNLGNLTASSASSLPTSKLHAEVCSFYAAQSWLLSYFVLLLQVVLLLHSTQRNISGIIIIVMQ